MYTLTSIGYGDIGPVNTTEYVVCTLLMTSASIFWAFTVANFCSIVSTMDMHGVEFRRRMDELNYMLKDLQVPREISRRCRMYFYQSRRLQRVHTYHETEDYLSSPLKQELWSGTYLRMLRSVWYFQRCSDDFLQEITAILKPVLYAPHEHFDRRQTMYISLRGIAAKLGRPMGKHSIWNQDFILEDELHSEGTHACALTYVEVLIVDRWEVERILENYLPDKEVLARARAFYKFKHAVITWAHEMARERLGEVRALPRPRVSRANSLRRPGALTEAAPPGHLQSPIREKASHHVRRQETPERISELPAPKRRP